MPLDNPAATSLSLLEAPTRNLFFTGKGGVGKTSIACAVALALADSGKRVLLVSTDPASNLDEMLGLALGQHPTPVPAAPGLAAMNIDPDAAAEAYRARVVAQMGAAATDSARATVREQLSGACTTEIAAFDEFAALLAEESTAFDHIVFDTAPTGHTLRLLALPKAWSGFLAGNDRGASCLGPHSGLKMQEARFQAARAALGDGQRTTIVLVTRPDVVALREAARSAAELEALGLANQRLVINGVFAPSDPGDPIARAIQALGASALAGMPESLRRLPTDRLALRAFDMVGLPALRALLGPDPVAPSTSTASAATREPTLPSLGALIDTLAQAGHGLIMVMGKGGVGKTTIAAAIAIGLVDRGHRVHLSTTDPAAHVSAMVEGALEGLRVDRIDPKAETERYIERIMASRGAALDEAGRALLREDLNSPCTEEVAVFHAFSRVVGEARNAFVVLDTAPTGHTLLLMDATGAYHRQMLHDLDAARPGRVVTPLMRLQDADHTKVVLVTLAETTPVSEAAALQEDLRRARIEPYAWLVNRTLLGTPTRDPLLLARMQTERLQIERVRTGLARRLYALPWQADPPIGVARLSTLAAR